MILEALQQNALAWFEEEGIGYYPVKDSPYDKSYFKNYQKITDTEIGRKLNEARIELVNKYTTDDVIDIGIGSGVFCKERPNTKGFDINQSAVEWLVGNGLFKHPMKGATSLSFWDSIEHIHNPANTLQFAKEYVFISTPIYDDLTHLMSSKHRKYSEHCWYFTSNGLVRFMDYYGFEIKEISWIETKIGREDIGSFVFKRIGV